MIDKEQILLLDEQTKFDIRKKPKATYDMTNGFSIYEFGDTNLKNSFVVTETNKKIQLNEYDKCGYLIASSIYNNVYYPIEVYDKCYKKDFRNLLNRIVYRIGAQDFFMSYSDDTNYNEEDSREYIGGFKVSHPAVKADANVNINSISSKESDIKHMVNLEINMSKQEVSREQFYDWVDKESINLKVYDSIGLAAFLDRFDDFGKIDHGILSYKDVSIEHIGIAHNKSMKISGGFNYAPSFIKGKFDFENINKFSSNTKIAEKFKVYIKF
ncbi:hypothetical protein [Brachyspira innocens]|uniref:hypothetical protein n=1 Tax=Brachyspira innocens TaxID=13264 RepID=UPI00036E6F89|nr:hypothetical protein [Brachyspira innocens]